MSSKHLRYRIGIDVGLYSVGLAAIEIDDSSSNPYDAMPIDFLSIMSVIHDGGVDPSAQKIGDSRKAVSGVARRTRRLHKQQQKLRRELDAKLKELGYPVDRAVALLTTSEQKDPYIAWRARAQLVEGYVSNKSERELALTVALRHLIRHRGWRNPYSSVESLNESPESAQRLFADFLERANAFRSENGLALITDEEGGNLTVAQIMQPLLEPLPQNRFRQQDEGIYTLARIDKLHQATYYQEMKRMLEVQKVPEDVRDELLKIVFFVKNPKDVGAASERVGFDDLQPGKRRASRASIAFQQYRILTTIANLRIKESGKSRELTLEEKQSIYELLTSAKVAQSREDLTWHDVADALGLERNALSGTGGTTEDGMPVSSQYPPILNTDKDIYGLPKELNAIKDWWHTAEQLEKEFFVELLGNAGVQGSNLSEAELGALSSAKDFLVQLGTLDEEAMAKLDKIKLASGRVAYSVDTLMRINKRMLEGGLGLHEARKAEFGIDDSWRPAPNELGTPTGNPAVDRTIRIVSRWVKACVKRWGEPETVNIEHVREGFMSEKQHRDYVNGVNARYRANQKAREELSENDSIRGDYSVMDIKGMNRSDTRRLQAIQRQNCQCLYCGKPINYTTAQMDHIVPRKGPGSSNVLPNLVATCEQCNASKSSTLFSTWASPEQMKETIERVNGMIRDSYFSTEREFGAFKKDVIARLKRKEEDPPIDSRSIESVAWMARELREQIAGYLSHGKSEAKADVASAEDFRLVQVFRGSITSEARKASGIEGQLPWYGGRAEKDRLDRRHHAVDAAVIALLRPSVAKTLIERDAIRQEQSALGPRTVGKEWGTWKQYEGAAFQDKSIYRHWRDEQMERLTGILNQAMETGRIVVTKPLRLRLGLGKAHADTVYSLTYKCVGDSLSAAAIDKAETPALWMALTSHPDYTVEDGLPQDPDRQIRVCGKTLKADSLIGFLAMSEQELDREMNAVYAPARGGMVGIGDAIHHARFYRIPKKNGRGEQTGWQYAMMRVFQYDLLRHSKEDLFHVELGPQSISMRSCDSKLKLALKEGSAEYLGWAVSGQEVLINPESSPTFSISGSAKSNALLQVFPDCARYEIRGFSTRSKILLGPMALSSEGSDGLDYWDAEILEKAKKVLELGVRLEVNPVLKSSPIFVQRNALGDLRWRSNNNMPVCWTVPRE